MQRWFWTVVAVVACSSARYASSPESGATLIFPAKFAEGEAQDGGSADAAPIPDAAPMTPKLSGSLPDPEPLRLPEQWEYELVYDAGQVRVASVRARRFPKPIVTARRMGRFAVELWIGHELVDRVRFDFPMLAADEPPSGPRRPLHSPPDLGARARSTQRVLVPASPRATRAVLVDRATEHEQVLPWPPDRPLASATAADAGGAGAAGSAAQIDGGG